MGNLDNWNKVSTPPPNVLKKITGGRLSGMTNISPQWRYQVMTEAYGPCGIGWKYVVVKKWTEPGANGQIFAFVDIELFIKDGDEWSDAIPGHGGSMLIVKEKHGPYSDDEAYKKATTDALSTSMKMLGVGSDIYMGNWDGSKYTNRPMNGKGGGVQQTQKIPANNALGADAARYKSRLEGTAQYGIIYARKCWKQTPENIQKELGRDFKTALYKAAEEADTAQKQCDAKTQGSGMKLALKKQPKEADSSAANPLLSTPEYAKYAEARDRFPNIAQTLPEPTTKEQCLDAANAISREADKQTS